MRRFCFLALFISSNLLAWTNQEFQDWEKISTATNEEVHEIVNHDLPAKKNYISPSAEDIIEAIGPSLVNVGIDARFVELFQPQIVERLNFEFLDPDKKPLFRNCWLELGCISHFTKDFYKSITSPRSFRSFR